MCGISCIVTLSSSPSANASLAQKDKTRDRLHRSLERIRHRGPDSSGHWVSEDGRVALGHVRLEINDLSSTGAQPLHHYSQNDCIRSDAAQAHTSTSSSTGLHAVVNGEIYDYPRLRKEMEDQISYPFVGTSDCELVLALYKFYGLSFLTHLRGEFSLCLYDAERELFIAVRDRYGIKPLFWTEVVTKEGEKELWVAAECKAFLGFGWEPEWDVEGIIGGDFQIGKRTIFRGVQKVLPGHVLVCRSFGNIGQQMYWDVEYPDKRVEDPRSEVEMVEGVRERLLESIRERLRADVKVGVSLSGGLDSSVVAGMVNHLIREGYQIGSETHNERLSCFGIAFDAESGFDESETANRTADFLGVKFHKKHMDEKNLADMFEEATWSDEQPNPDLNFVGVYALSELFREKGFRVNINGQGADEVFGGYNIFLPDYLREADEAFAGEKVGDQLRLNELKKAEEKLQEVYTAHLDLTDSAKSVARRQLGNTLTPAQMALAFPNLPFKEDLLPPSGRMPDATLTYAENIDGRVLEKMQTHWHPAHSAQYTFIKGHLQNLLLSNLGDRGEMSHSIEGRTPFLDHKLTQYVDGLPPSMKVRWDEGTKGWVEKWVLREAGKEFITEEIYTKRKHPYSAPVVFGREGPLYKLLKGLVRRQNVEELGFLRAEEVEGLVEEAFSGKEGKMGVFRLVICLAQWVVLQRRFGVKRFERVKVELVEEDNAGYRRKGENVMLG